MGVIHMLAIFNKVRFAASLAVILITVSGGVVIAATGYHTEKKRWFGGYLLRAEGAGGFEIQLDTNG